MAVSNWLDNLLLSSIFLILCNTSLLMVISLKCKPQQKQAALIQNLMY